jgi:hypothetical protein
MNIKNFFQSIGKCYYVLLAIYAQNQELITDMATVKELLTDVSNSVDDFRTSNEALIKDVSGDIDTLNEKLAEGDNSQELIDLATGLKTKIDGLSNLNTSLKTVADRTANATPDPEPGTGETEDPNAGTALEGSGADTSGGNNASSAATGAQSSGDATPPANQ